MLSDLSHSAGKRIYGGAELNTESNAISDGGGNETDATTGWTSVGLDGTGANVFESQSSVKYIGSYAFHTDANDTPTANCRIWKDIGTDFSLQNGEQYYIELYARHIGTGGVWACNIGADNDGVPKTTDLRDVNNSANIESSEVTFIRYSRIFTYDATYRYLAIREASAANDGGVYVDNLSIRKIG